MIVPSIDLRDGRAVQLRQGRDLLLVDGREPVELARRFGRLGPVAVVDLDAALGTGDNRDLVAACCAVARCRVGGGIRSSDDVHRWIRAGADKVMIGTRAEPEFLASFPPEWIVACLDARAGEVVDHGWTRGTGRPVLERARAVAPFAGELLYTCVEREGMLAGPDLETPVAIREATGLPVTVAGGIASVDDVRRLDELGCNAQLGRAIYEGRLDPVDAWVALVRRDERGLVPVVVQDVDSGAVLMLAWADDEALRQALVRGEGWYRSRSRGESWRKGATSGHTQELVEARWDCDRDAVLYRVRQTGPACHLGRTSCFPDVADDARLDVLESTIARRTAGADRTSYTVRLLEQPDLLAAKLREETEEVIEAGEREHVVWECADVLYHLLVRMAAAGVSLREVERELRSRRRPNG